MSTKSLTLKVLQSKEKSYMHPLRLAFFMLLTLKHFELFHKYNGYGFVSESFDLNSKTFVPLVCKKLLD